MSDLARQLWLERKPLAQTPAASYLRLPPRPAQHIQQAIGAGTYDHEGIAVPTVIAAMRSLEGVLKAVQRTFLHPDQSRPLLRSCTCPACCARPVRVWAGEMDESAVQLGAPAEIMGLADSVEEALAAARRYSLPVWAACGAGRMHAVWMPREVKHLILFMRPRHVASGQADHVCREHLRDHNFVEVLADG